MLNFPYLKRWWSKGMKFDLQTKDLLIDHGGVHSPLHPLIGYNSKALHGQAST